MGLQVYRQPGHLPHVHAGPCHGRQQYLLRGGATGLRQVTQQGLSLFGWQSRHRGGTVAHQVRHAASSRVQRNAWQLGDFTLVRLPPRGLLRKAPAVGVFG